MNKRHLTPGKLVLLFLLTLPVTSCSTTATKGELNVGARYEIVKPIYLQGTYNDLNDRSVTPEKALAYLHDEKYANRAHTAFQVKVPVGTVMTVVSLEGSVLHFPYWVDKYYVNLSPDISRGLKIVLTLDRGMQGELNGLNQELFRRIERF